MTVDSKFLKLQSLRGVMSEIKATLVYVMDTQQDKVLMIYRNRKPGDEHKGKYNGLGGKLELGETHYDCAVREVKEESGLDISDLEFKGEILFPKFDKKLNDWRVFVYRADSYSNTLIEKNREGDLKWILKKDILSLNLWEGDKFFLPKVFESGGFIGTIFYKNGALDPSRPIELKMVQV